MWMDCNSSQVGANRNDCASANIFIYGVILLPSQEHWWHYKCIHCKPSNPSLVCHNSQLWVKGPGDLAYSELFLQRYRAVNHVDAHFSVPKSIALCSVAEISPFTCSALASFVWHFSQWRADLTACNWGVLNLTSSDCSIIIFSGVVIVLSWLSAISTGFTIFKPPRQEGRDRSFLTSGEDWAIDINGSHQV